MAEARLLLLAWEKFGISLPEMRRGRYVRQVTMALDLLNLEAEIRHGK